jgi:asparagine synthase (glutamine-hydrolysing)
MPPGYLFRHGWSKYVLRTAMESLLPPEIVWRREKLGFPFPARSVLETARPLLAGGAERVFQEGLSPACDYNELLERDALRLWRMGSVGLWLDAALSGARTGV